MYSLSHGAGVWGAEGWSPMSPGWPPGPQSSEWGPLLPSHCLSPSPQGRPPCHAVGGPELPGGASPHLDFSLCCLVNGEAPDGPFFLRMPLACGSAAAHHPLPAPPGSAHQGVGLAALPPPPGHTAATASVIPAPLPRTTVGKRGHRGWWVTGGVSPERDRRRQCARRSLPSGARPGSGGWGEATGPAWQPGLLPTIPSHPVPSHH